MTKLFTAKLWKRHWSFRIVVLKFLNFFVCFWASEFEVVHSRFLKPLLKVEKKSSMIWVPINFVTIYCLHIF